MSQDNPFKNMPAPKPSSANLIAEEPEPPAYSHEDWVAYIGSEEGWSSYQQGEPADESALREVLSLVGGNKGKGKGFNGKGGWYNGKGSGTWSNNTGGKDKGKEKGSSARASKEIPKEAKGNLDFKETATTVVSMDIELRTAANPSSSKGLDMYQAIYQLSYPITDGVHVDEIGRYQC